jgi:hypothetical protein
MTEGTPRKPPRKRTRKQAKRPEAEEMSPESEEIRPEPFDKLRTAPVEGQEERASTSSAHISLGGK